MKALLLNPKAEYSEGYDSIRENYIEVQLLAYDRDKYVLLKLPDGDQEEFKSGYIRRIDNLGYLTARQLFSLPVTDYTNDGIGIGEVRTKRQVQAELRSNYKHKTTFKVLVDTYKEFNADYIKGIDNVTVTIKVPTLKKAIRVFRKHKSVELLFKTDRFNYEGIAKRDPFVEKGTLFYDVNNRNNRPTYSAKALRELDK